MVEPNACTLGYFGCHTYDEEVTYWSQHLTPSYFERKNYVIYVKEISHSIGVL